MRHFVIGLARISALAGGIVLTLLILMTCTSVLGRAFSKIGLGPVPGDFELVEAGIAFCVFAFLPFCQIVGAHATVDILTNSLPASINRLLIAFWEVLMAVVIAVIAWRLLVGAQAKFSNGETTLLLQFPVWWVYLACLFPAAIGIVVALWSSFDRVRSVVTGRDSRTLFGESGH